MGPRPAAGGGALGSAAWQCRQDFSGLLLSSPRLCMKVAINACTCWRVHVFGSTFRFWGGGGPPPGGPPAGGCPCGGVAGGACPCAPECTAALTRSNERRTANAEADRI